MKPELIAKLTEKALKVSLCDNGQREYFAIHQANVEEAIRLAYAEGKKDGMTEAAGVCPRPKNGWWSWIRSVLAQGTDIHQDYLAGRHGDYEAYAARLDAAAREREGEIPDCAQAILAKRDEVKS